jgi:integrase
VEIIKEASKNSNKDFVFASPLGICSLLGLKPFTPHDLRRTAATLAGDLGFDDAWIAKRLDHAASKKSEQIVPTVTGKVYNHSKRMKEKRAVLDGVAAELRRIIAKPAEAEAQLRLVA